MLELGPLTPAFLFLAISEVALGTYVLSKGRTSPVNRTFFWLTILAGTGSLLDLLVASLTYAELAAWAFRSLVFLLVIEMGVAYHLSTLVPFPSPMLLLGNDRRAYGALVLGTAIAFAAAVGPMVNDRYGWVPATDLPFAFLLLTVYLAALVLTLRRKWRTLEGLNRGRTGILFLALAVPALVMIAIMGMATTGVEVPRMYGLGELVSVALLTYGILRYQLLVIPRGQEAAAPKDRIPSLARGRAYLFEGKDSDRMFRAVVQEVSKGTAALVISRAHPDHLRSRYMLAHTPFLWLAQSPGPDRIDPTNLQLLTHMVLEFIKEGPALIAIEGLEYIIVNNDLTRVLKFLGQLRDSVMVSGSVLLVVVDPATLTERQRAILERELEVIKEEEGAETAI
ncbi:MAG TPA: DUF835 domain-containing protein [Methanomassiliicoccales archaeon]|nr:DUF835 domain-containing protein [Methanomassiliicoccales archaeon]